MDSDANFTLSSTRSRKEWTLGEALYTYGLIVISVILIPVAFYLAMGNELWIFLLVPALGLFGLGCLGLRELREGRLFSQTKGPEPAERTSGAGSQH